MEQRGVKSAHQHSDGVTQDEGRAHSSTGGEYQSMTPARDGEAFSYTSQSSPASSPSIGCRTFNWLHFRDSFMVLQPSEEVSKLHQRPAHFTSCDGITSSLPYYTFVF